uniref:Uncharacterized protein n=1 Tax=Anopheles atroparvus TaxID=41427 RepID=A0AAG5DUY6_ANOAO
MPRNSDRKRQLITPFARFVGVRFSCSVRCSSNPTKLYLPANVPPRSTRPKTRGGWIYRPSRKETFAIVREQEVSQAERGICAFAGAKEVRLCCTSIKLLELPCWSAPDTQHEFLQHPRSRIHATFQGELSVSVS